MGLFSRVRRQQTAPVEAEPQAVVDDTPPSSPPEPIADTAAAADSHSAPAAVATLGAPARAGTAGLAALRDGLQQLYSIRPSRDAFAEEAIKLIARSTSTKAAALLTYEPRGGRMQLVGQVGLEPEAEQVLSGDAMVSGWDIPLRSIRNRRINVIESAHENPFVPKPLAAVSPRRLTIAAVPFFHANAPVGVVVLFSPTPRGFADGLLKTLSQSLRVCALALSELPMSAAATARVIEEEATATQPTLLRGLSALKTELARLSQALEESERQRASETAERVTAQSFLKAAQERSALLDQQLAELRAAQAQVPEIEERAHDLSRRLATASEAADAARSEVTRLEAAAAEHAQHAAAQDNALIALKGERASLETQLQEALDTARARGEEAATLHAQVSDLAPRAAKVGELTTALSAADAARAETESVIARLRQELVATHEQRSRAEAALEQASAALASSEDERRTLGTTLESAQAAAAELARARDELSALHDALHQREVELASRGEELERVRSSLSADSQQRDAEADAARARITALEHERGTLGSELASLRADASAKAQALVEHGDRVANQHAQLEAARTDAARIDAERAELARKLAALEADLQAATTARRQLEAELTAQQTARDALAAQQRELETRIHSLTAGGQTLEQERRATQAAAEQRVGTLEAEIARLTASLDSTRSGAADEITRARHDAEATLDRLRVELAETSRTRDELQRALAAAQQESATHQRALADMAAQRARLETAIERLTAERSELGSRVQESTSSQADLSRAHGEAQSRIAALERELAAVRDEQLAGTQAKLAAEETARRAAESTAASAATRFAEELAQLQEQLAVQSEEQERLSLQLAEQSELLQSAEQNLGVLELPAEGDDGDDVLEIDRDAPEPGDEPAGAELADEGEAAGAGELILLDAFDGAADTARKLADFGHHVSALSTTPQAIEMLRDRTVAGAALNLAAPDAWSLVRQLRGSGVARMPLIAYALADKAPKGFWLGPVDFAPLPVSELKLPELLNQLVPRVRRVLAMSNDIDVMSDVRTQLTAVGISTAVVLDGRQALDLVPTIRPELAILHLSPSCVDVFRAIAGLRAADIARDIPILFLLDEQAQPREEAFLTAGVRTLTSRGGLALDSLVDTLATAFDGYRS
jgi:predicted  nucleic acid-binding Zn-ribbon protein